MNMTTQEAFPEVKLAKRLPVEDIQIGTYITVINESHEFPSYLWCLDSGTQRKEETVRIQFRSRFGGYPLKVVDICLPYIYVKMPFGNFRTFDSYSFQFVKLDQGYAKRVWKKIENEFSDSKKKKKKGKKKKSKRKEK